MQENDHPQLRPKKKPSKHPRCQGCGFRIRGKGHKEGPHHLKGRTGDEMVRR